MTGWPVYTREVGPITGSNVTASGSSASGPYTQWAAVRNTFGATSVPEHTSGRPSGRTTTSAPTFGCAVPSGSPYEMAPAGATPRVSTAATSAATSSAGLRIGPSQEVARIVLLGTAWAKRTAGGRAYAPAR